MHQTPITTSQASNPPSGASEKLPGASGTTWGRSLSSLLSRSPFAAGENTVSLSEMSVSIPASSLVGWGTLKSLSGDADIVGELS